jgi:multidrug efflux system membrane fusion protein
VVILRIRPVNVVFSVPEQHLPEIQKARASGRVPVEARVTGDSGSPLRGELSFVQNTVDSSTGTIQIKASFENLDNRLWPGQYVNVIVMLSTQQDAVAAPFEAIQTGQKGTYVFVVKADRTVELRPVVVARTFGDQAVVERGLTPGEQVVTVGQLRLTPGAAVEIKGPAENAAARTAAR